MNTRNLLRAMAAFGFAFAGAGLAQAEAVQYNYYSFPTFVGTTPTLVSITPSGGTSITFLSKKAGLTAVTFSAECSVYGAVPGGYWLSISILIDGVAVAPTGSDEVAFCTEPATVSDNYAMQSITVARSLTKGTHTLTVQASVTGNNGWLDDVAVLVSR